MWLAPAAVVLGTAVLVLAFVRGRRMGALVVEPLPVVVRAVETTESRGRIYRRARDRARAAAVLRLGSTDRLARRLALPPHATEAVQAAAAAASGMPPAQVAALLAGPPPTTDVELHTLANCPGRSRGEGPYVMTDQHQFPPPEHGRRRPASAAPAQQPAVHPAAAPDARAALLAVRAEVAKAVVGQDAAVAGLLVALLAQGHILLEGVPGVAKTLLVRSIAAALDVETKRVQFTPDLMPGDLTGSLVYDAANSDFTFRQGPVFTNLLLADEINRTPPKTQSALLEAMEERQVSVDGRAHPLPQPFMVAATQNPVEYEGTYPLPEAQLDRFLLKVTLPLPPREDEIAVLRRHATGFDPRDLHAAGLRPVASAADLAAGAEAVRTVEISDEVTAYIVDIARATRSSPSLALGREPARGHRADGDLPRVGVDQRPRVRHPRRRQGARPRHPRAPAVAATGGRARGRQRAPRSSRARSERCRSRADGPDLPRRGAGPAGAGAGRPVAAGRHGALVVGRDAGPHRARRAARLVPARACTLTREGPGQVRLGEDTRHLAAGHQRRAAPACAARSATPGRRRPGPTPPGTRSTSRAGERTRVTTTMHPTRRGDRVAAPGHGALHRPTRAGRAPALVRGARAAAHPAPVPGPQAPAQPAGRAAPARRPGGAAHPRPGHRVRQPARLRRRRRRPQHRLAGHRSAPAPRRAHLAARAAPSDRHRHRHLAHLRRSGRRRAPARRRDGCRPAARPRWPATPATGCRCSPATAWCRRGSAAPTGPSCCTTRSAPWPRSRRGWSRPTGRCWPPRSGGWAPSAPSSCC